MGMTLHQQRPVTAQRPVVAAVGPRMTAAVAMVVMVTAV
jgi:hypothetical protein